MVWTYEGPVLFWTAPKAKDEMDKAVQNVVYRFDKKEKKEAKKLKEGDEVIFVLSGRPITGGYYNLKSYDMDTKEMHCYKMDFPITYITNKDAHNLWIGTINGL